MPAASKPMSSITKSLPTRSRLLMSYENGDIDYVKLTATL